MWTQNNYILRHSYHVIVGCIILKNFQCYERTYLSKHNIHVQPTGTLLNIALTLPVQLLTMLRFRFLY